MDFLLVGGHDGLDIHDPTSGELLRSFDTGDVLAVQPLPSAPGTALMAVTGRTAWSIWDLASDQLVRTMNGWPLDNAPSCVALTPEGLPVFVIAEGGLLRRVTWDPGAEKMTVSTIPWERRLHDVRSLVAIPPRPQDGRVIVAVVGGEDIALIDVNSKRYGSGLVRLLRTDVEPQCLHTFAAQGKVLLAASSSDGIQIWDTDEWTGRPLSKWTASDTLSLTHLVMPDGTTLLASGDAGSVRIWDPWTGDLRHTLLTGAPVHALAADTAATGTVIHIFGPAGLATVAVELP